jgi:hypothetical protein
MDMQQIESTVIQAAGYARVLEIEFQSGRIYQYYEVDEAVYQAFLESDSKGRYFNAHIRGRFPYREILIRNPPQKSEVTGERV